MRTLPLAVDCERIETSHARSVARGPTYKLVLVRSRRQMHRRRKTIRAARHYNLVVPITGGKCKGFWVWGLRQEGDLKDPTRKTL